MVIFTWTQILNGIFEAHRTGDLVAKKIWQDMLADCETFYADTLDSVNY